MPPIPEYLQLPPEQAIAYFNGKVPIPTGGWRDFEAQHHDFAYTVAGLNQADLLEVMLRLISEALSEGTSFEDFLEQFDVQVRDRGWEPRPLPAGPPDWRMRIMFETPIRRAYSAGRRQQMRSPVVMQRRRWGVWKHGDSPSPRPNHLALHNSAILLENSDFWDVAWPPCGYGCKCRVFSADDRTVERMGYRILNNPPDPYSIAEEGFQRAPGLSPAEERRQILESGIQRLSPPLQQQAQENLRRRGLA